MKLVEILARELEKWPEDGGPVEAVVQDPEMMCYVRADDDSDEFAFRQNEWIGVWHNMATARALSELASDHATAIVTREMWQAERERIAKSGKKANADGWVRHRGGKCPVSQGDFIEYRMRAGGIGSCCGQIELLDWSHSGSGGDIMSYRFRKQSDEEIQMNQSVKDARNGCAEQQIDLSVSPLAWRDRIREIDRTVEALEEERVSLIQRLEGEGLQLLVGKVCGGVQPVEGMSDPANWLQGDLVECVGNDEGRAFVAKLTVGKLYRVDNVGCGTAWITDDDGDEQGSPAKRGAFKWHSRPST